MPRLSINASYKSAIDKLNVINRYLIKSKGLQSDMQGFVAEVLMLRLFGILETCMLEVSIRIACGVPYRNGMASHPIVLCTSKAEAMEKFHTEGRPCRINNLQFSNVHNISKTIKYVIDASEPLRIKLSRYGNEFEEMRKIRNHIAHHTQSTLSDYKQVIRTRYGANLKIKPGTFLISTKREPIALIETYFQTVKIIIDDVTKG